MQGGSLFGSIVCVSIDTFNLDFVQLALKTKEICLNQRSVHGAGSMQVLVQGEPVRPQPTLLSLRGGGEGCSLAWLDVGGAPVVTAGVPATMVIETRDPAGKRIPNVRPKP